MARIRTIKPELYEDEDLAELSLEAAHVVFPRLWQLADARGLLPCRPRFLTAECFRYRREYTVEQTEAYLRELEDVGAVFRYSVGNRDYIALPNFCRHQRIKADEWDALARQILAGQATPEPEGEDPTWPLDQVRHALARVIPKGAPQGVTWLPAEELPTRYRLGAATVPQRCRNGTATVPGTHRGVNRDGKGKGKGKGNGNGNGNGDSKKGERSATPKPPTPPETPEPATSHKPPRPKTPGLQELTDEWFQAFEDETGQKPSWGPKHAANLKRLVKAHGVGGVRLRLANYLRHHKAGTFGSELDFLGSFVTRFDRWAKPPDKATARASPRGSPTKTVEESTREAYEAAKRLEAMSRGRS